MEEVIVREEIQAIEFRIMSPKLVEKMSVVRVVTPEMYDVDGYPVEGGLMDLRMGIVDPGLRCRTCGSRVKECPGHFGSIELARPIMHIKYVPWVYDFLRGMCAKCGRVRITQDSLSKYDEKIEHFINQKNQNQLQLLLKEIKKRIFAAKKCVHCGEETTKIKLIKPSTFMEEDVRLTPIDVRDRLEKIPDSDLKYFGLDSLAGRPEWMILTLLLVPPVTVRPSITLESGARSEDDLTHKLGDIVRTNQRLFENLNAGAPEIIIEDLWDLLQYHVTTFFVNNISQIPPARHRSGRPLKTLAERIKSKEGRFRKNLAGKRVDFSARSVISPDPDLAINEVGVPKDIARELTVPERVTEWNIEWLKEFVKRGNIEYPGANYVVTQDGKRKRITDETKEAILTELTFGYLVERHLIDGDIAIFNRQPSLHKMSMMVHRVRVLPYRTFRLNTCVAPPYNADFDGDEMNLHIPQTEEARSEAEVLLDVYKNIITPRYGYPIIGCAQDQVSGCYLLTQDDSFFTKEETCDLLMKAWITEDLPKPEKKGFWSGKQIFSMILPKVNYEGRTKKSSRERVVIKDGKLISGQIDSVAIGARSGRLVQEIYLKFGPEETGKFLKRASMLGINTLMKRGFSSYISDTDLPEASVKEISGRLDSAEAQAYELIYQYNKGEMGAYPGKTVRETVESKIMTVLNMARNDTSKIVEDSMSKSGNNPTLTMADSGAKGSALNLALISSSVGQQALRGTRINKGYHERTLPHFETNDISPKARGFVRHGYKEGLNAFEFYFHAVTGRDSMMDTSMRTPKSGYLQRRLVNALLDLRVFEDKTVRDSSGTIVQFIYGDDGLDVAKSKGGKFPDVK